MRKNITKIAVLAMITAVVVTTGWSYYKSTQEIEMNQLALANVEALASGESGGYSCTISRDCGGGNTISCTGNTMCEFVSGPLGSMSGRGVKCDGNITRCPS